jgi:hypothetical protein
MDTERKVVARNGFYHETHRKQLQDPYKFTMRSTQNAKYHPTTTTRWLQIHNEMDTERKEDRSSSWRNFLEIHRKQLRDPYECTMGWTQNAKYHLNYMVTNPQRDKRTDLPIPFW